MQPTHPSSATASPTTSSPPDLPTPGGLCAIHQPNFLPRLTTLAKLFAADYWIILDDVQLTGGMTYLDPAPFAAHGIAVTPFRPPPTTIWSSGRRLSALWGLATLGPQTVAGCLPN